MTLAKKNSPRVAQWMPRVVVQIIYKNGDFRMEGRFNGEVQPLFGTLLEARGNVSWSDGTMWIRKH